jgi:hypothetical protein
MVSFDHATLAHHRLNAATDPSEQLTFSTHLVHPAIILAGEDWPMFKFVIQGEDKHEHAEARWFPLPQPIPAHSLFPHSGDYPSSFPQIVLRFASQQPSLQHACT